MNPFTLNSQSARSGVLQPLWEFIHSLIFFLSFSSPACSFLSYASMVKCFDTNHLPITWQNHECKIYLIYKHLSIYPFLFLFSLSFSSSVFRSFTVSNTVMCFRTFLQDDSFTKGKYTSLPPSFSLHGVNKLFCITVRQFTLDKFFFLFQNSLQFKTNHCRFIIVVGTLCFPYCIQSKTQHTACQFWSWLCYSAFTYRKPLSNSTNHPSRTPHTRTDTHKSLNNRSAGEHH